MTQEKSVFSELKRCIPDEVFKATKWNMEMDAASGKLKRFSGFVNFNDLTEEGKKNAQQAGYAEGDRVEFGPVEIEGKTTLGIVKAEIVKTEEAKPGKSKEGCFVATAVYGSPEAPEVRLLRRFRDRVLMQSQFGRILVENYYCISPQIVRIMNGSKILQNMVKKLLLCPLVKFIDRSVKL
jgi:hypothetical protein